MWLLVIGTVLVFAVAILIIARILYITDPSKVAGTLNLQSFSYVNIT